MRVFKINIIVLFLFLSSLVMGQVQNLSWEEFEKISQEITKVYAVDTYILNMEYQTFKGKQVVTPYEVSKGFIQKSGTQTYSYLKGIVTIANSKIKLTIDSNNNLVAINNGGNTQDQDDLLAQYKQIKSMISSLTSNRQSSSTEIKITYKKGSPISEVKIRVNDKHELMDVTVFYAKAREYEDENGEIKSDYVTLKIKYDKPQKKKVNKEIKVTEVVQQREGNYILTSPFKKFELVDFRVKP